MQIQKCILGKIQPSFFRAELRHSTFWRANKSYFLLHETSPWCDHPLFFTYKVSNTEWTIFESQIEAHELLNACNLSDSAPDLILLKLDDKGSQLEFGLPVCSACTSSGQMRHQEE